MDLSQLNIGFFLGGDFDAVEKVGGRIQRNLLRHGIEVDILDISDACPRVCEAYDFFIFGIPTWDLGYTQQCWEGIEPNFSCSDLCGKIAALYVLGASAESEGYFLHAMSWLYEKVVKTGATVVSLWPEKSCNSVCPLALRSDQANTAEANLIVTDVHIENWTDQLVKECTQLLGELAV